MVKKISILFYLLTAVGIGYSQNNVATILNSVNKLNKSISISTDSSLIYQSNSEANRILLNLIVVPEGTNTMGSPSTEFDRYVDEVEHRVSLSAFLMSKYEITNEQFASFLNERKIDKNGLDQQGKYPTKVLLFESSDSTNWGLNYIDNKWVAANGCENYPVVNVTWFGASAFADFVGGSLPTEAQWEGACRASSSTPFSTGPCLSNTQANYKWAYQYGTCTNSEKKSPGKPQPVGSYPANPYGLCDMHGNVWEWCNDWYGPYSTSEQTNPSGPKTGVGRVYRGGSFHFPALYSRSSIRFFYYPEYYSSHLGFRVVFGLK